MKNTLVLALILHEATQRTIFPGTLLKKYWSGQVKYIFWFYLTGTFLLIVSLMCYFSIKDKQRRCAQDRMKKSSSASRPILTSFFQIASVGAVFCEFRGISLLSIYICMNIWTHMYVYIGYILFTHLCML